MILTKNEKGMNGKIHAKQSKMTDRDIKKKKNTQRNITKMKMKIKKFLIWRRNKKQNDVINKLKKVKSSNLGYLKCI